MHLPPRHSNARNNTTSTRTLFFYNPLSYDMKEQTR